MIPKRTIRKFLARKLTNYELWKKYSDERLEREQEKLPIRPPIWNRLRKAQKVMFLLGATRRRFGYHADTGVGKTMLSIALARYFVKLGECKRFLVLVPGVINKAEWAREVRKHTKQLECCVLEGSTPNKWQLLQTTKAQIVVETYTGLLHMLCDLEEVVKKGKPTGVNKMRPKPKYMSRMLKLVDGLILDESTNVKNHRKLPYRVCRKISRSVNHVFTLTGTPFGREPLDLWAQMYIVDKGETLGQTLGLFREVFFEATENFWGGVDYTFKADMQPTLHKMLANCAIRYKAEASDLPPVTRIIKRLDLPVAAESYYAQAKQELVKAKGTFREMKNAFVRMRQISSGFVGYYDQEEGARAQFEFPTNPKLDMLMSIIESLPTDQKIIVFHDFIFTGSMVERRLTEAKIGYVRLMTKGKKSDPAKVLHEFDHNPKKRVFILSTAGGFGLNLQIAKYAIFLESPPSVIMRKQMERRVERQGSQHDVVFIYDLIVRGTVDQNMLDFYKEGAALFDAIVEGEGPTPAQADASMRKLLDFAAR